MSRFDLLTINEHLVTSKINIMFPINKCDTSPIKSGNIMSQFQTFKKHILHPEAQKIIESSFIQQDIIGNTKFRQICINK